MQDRPDHVETTKSSPRMASIDADLLRGVHQRDRRALGRFFDHVFTFVYSLAYRMTGEHASAEDVTQEVFLKVYRAADRLDPERSPYPWLAAITTNTCRDLARRASTRAERPLDDALVAGLPDATAPPDEALVRREEAQIVERALLALDVQHRLVVLLRDYCGCTHEEIAGIVGSTHAAVRKRYSRAIEAMREHVRKWQQ